MRVLIPLPLPPLARLIISSLPATTKLNFTHHHTMPPFYLLPSPPSINLVALTLLPLHPLKKSPPLPNHHPQNQVAAQGHRQPKPQTLAALDNCQDSHFT